MIPSDGCPYRRPFAEYFADCPAFEPEVFTGTTLRGLPLTPIWSCVHMTVGEDPDQKGHRYARCVIGDAAARRAALFSRLLGPQVA